MTRRGMVGLIYREHSMNASKNNDENKVYEMVLWKRHLVSITPYRCILKTHGIAVANTEANALKSSISFSNSCYPYIIQLSSSLR